MRSRFDELTAIWIKKAEDDLLWAKNSSKGGFFGGACFICQATKHDDDFRELYQACRQLNNYYTDTRYPDIWDITRFDNKKLAEEALKLAEEILEFVKKKIEVWSSTPRRSFGSRKCPGLRSPRRFAPRTSI